MKSLLPFLAGLLLLPLPALRAAELKVAPIFSDHLVLQRDLPVPVWGTAPPGEVVTVEFAGQTKKATADGAGQWMVKLDALPASAEARELKMRAQEALTISDALVGEVWLGSGQSNMAGPMRTFRGNDEGLQKLLDAAPYLQIRLLKQTSAVWQPATAPNVDGFSAILFAYGTRLQAELKVPVGLMRVPQPAAVRYAWSSNAPWANLFNKDGLPAQTFRTDDWATESAPTPARPPRTGQSGN